MGMEPTKIPVPDRETLIAAKNTSANLQQCAKQLGVSATLANKWLIAAGIDNYFSDKKKQKRDLNAPPLESPHPTDVPPLDVYATCNVAPKTVPPVASSINLNITTNIEELAPLINKAECLMFELNLALEAIKNFQVEIGLGR